MSRHIVFCLCPGLPLFCIASALEVLRHANRFAGEDSYRWSLLCEADQPVQDGNGIWWHPSANIDTVEPPDLALVVAGFEAAHLDQPRLGAWLAAQARAGRSVGGISNGAFLLARKGLHVLQERLIRYASVFLSAPDPIGQVVALACV